MKELTGEWLKAANDDLSVIALIIDREDLTHLASFHAQQAIEKCLKAVIEEYQFTPVKTHNLEFLYSMVQEITNMNVDKKILAELDSLYIDSRYPGSMGLLPEGKPSLADVKLFYQTAQEMKDNIFTYLNKYSEK